uniref:Head fiber protein n=1 Tax=Siphoviridae sp. ct2hZ16 TaxID=2826276 RepID=A0A8S5QUW2_9CAUD|nr:MAG TPA: Head fiber protein [Siphoviridae sp. ct2hZ16]
MNKLLDGNGLLFALQGFMTKVTTLLGNKVDKVSGKQLSTNDYTTAEKNKLSGIATGANNYTLPTAGAALGGVKTTSTVTNASGYTPVPIIDGVPYYKDTNTTYSPATQSNNGLLTAADKKKLDAFGAASTYATTTYVGQQIAAAGHISKQIVTTLPAASAAKENVIYMVKKTSGSGSNLYDEYMLIDGKMELVGDSATKIDTLTNADITEILSKV